MTDPTEIVITASFCSALGIFAITAAARKLLGIQPPDFKTADPFLFPIETTEDAPDDAVPAPHPGIRDAESPYQPPSTDSEPPPEPLGNLPPGKIPTWFYHSFDLLGIGFIFVTFFGLVITSVRAASKSDAVLDSAGLIVSIAFQFVCAGIVTAFVITRIRPIAWLGLRWRKWPWVFVIAPGTVISMWIFFGGLQLSGFMDWVKSLGIDSMQDSVKLLQDESTDPLTLGLMAVAAVLVAPFCEEIVFRGYLYPAAKRFTGPWVACFFSAIIFASAHGNAGALLPLFVFGCVLVLIYEKTGSIWAPMAVHLCFNGATVLIQMAVRFYHLPIDSQL